MGELRLPLFIMFYLLCILVIGVSFSPIIFKFLTIWQAQQLWVQGCIGVMFSWSFFVNLKYIDKPNIPLGILHFWIAAMTGTLCFIALSNGRHDVFHFMPYFSFLCLLALHKMIVQHITTFQCVQIMNIIRYVLLGTLILCGLQVFGIAQFFELFTPGSLYDSNPVMGMLGNGTHLSGFLAMLSPVLMWRMNRLDILGLILLVLTLCFTGSSVGDPSVSGFAILVVVWVYMNHRRKWVLLGSGVVLLFVILGVWAYLPHNFFGTNGRIDLWRTYWQLFKQMPVTGAGLGTVELIFREKPMLTQFAHLHMEYFQFAFEIGLIGLGLILWLILDLLQLGCIKREQMVYKAVVIGFLVSCCFNYPAHLWLPSTYAMIAYSCFVASQGRVKC